MDEDLTRLAGEQALLRRDAQQLRAQHERDKRSLALLANDIDLGQRGWLERGIELLRRLDADQARLHELQARVAELGRLTGM